MDSFSTSGSSSASSIASTLDSKPLWKYVTKLEKMSDGGGNIKWICNFCNQQKQGTYTTVRAHLLKLPGRGISVCPSVGNDTLAELKKWSLI